ncbi:ATPase PAAT-like isoform 1-T1 [Molossus nigricans]
MRCYGTWSPRSREKPKEPEVAPLHHLPFARRKPRLPNTGSGAGLACGWPNGDPDGGRAVGPPPDAGLFLGCGRRGPGPAPPGLRSRSGRPGPGLGRAAGAACPGDLAVLKRSPGSRGEEPCCLHLACDPDGGAQVGAVGVLSSARNMEVYVGAEYCGTGRGSSVGTVLDRREHENIILYKKYLKLESSTHACKVKLLSFGEKQCVFVSQVVVHVQPVSANSSASSPALGSRVDLERVQTMVESMGSPLSPGAQQLMRMVRFQQQNGVPIGEQLQSVLGNAAQRMAGLQSSSPLGALDGSSPSPSPCRAALPAGRLVEGLAAGTDGRSGPPGEALRTALGQCEPLPQDRALPQRAGEHAVSALVPERAGGRSGPPQADVLSLLQSLCGQASRLRVEPHREWPGPGPKPRDGLVDAAMGEQPVCSYLEKILSKNMERLEKKLADYIDQRIYRLQEHFDNKIALLMDLLQSPSSPPHGLPLRHYDSGETLSNGER